MTNQLHDAAETAGDRPGVARSATTGATLRRSIGAAAAATVLALAVSGATASADSCHGDIVSGITSNWPFAHGGQKDFAPPKGGFALWVDTFGFGDGPGEDNQTIRDLCRI